MLRQGRGYGLHVIDSVYGGQCVRSFWSRARVGWSPIMTLALVAGRAFHAPRCSRGRSDPDMEDPGQIPEHARKRSTPDPTSESRFPHCPTASMPRAAAAGAGRGSSRLRSDRRSRAHATAGCAPDGRNTHWRDWFMPCTSPMTRNRRAGSSGGLPREHRRRRHEGRADSPRPTSCASSVRSGTILSKSGNSARLAV